MTHSRNNFRDLFSISKEFLCVYSVQVLRGKVEGNIRIAWKHVFFRKFGYEQIIDRVKDVIISTLKDERGIENIQREDVLILNLVKFPL